ncbi:MAG: protein-S-isoprenylcysteine O-methyltransferase Ste14 [Alphaproteobacteria bacterium]
MTDTPPEPPSPAESPAPQTPAAETPAPQTPAHGPDVFTFPPVIFAIFLIMGYITDRGFPVAIGAPVLRQIAGGALIGLGVALAGWAIARFRKAKTHLDVRKPATALVTDGPYRFTRNPMYVAASLLYAGIAVIFGKIFMLAFLIPCLLLIDIFIIRREESYLDALFGEPYREFRRNVRRWL